MPHHVTMTILLQSNIPKQHRQRGLRGFNKCGPIFKDHVSISIVLYSHFFISSFFRTDVSLFDKKANAVRKYNIIKVSFKQL